MTDLAEIACSIIDRIEANLLPLEGDQCREWQGTRKKKGGYGQLSVGPRGAAKSLLAHRLVFALAHGDPGILDVLHRCDNPPCCRLDHLFKGTKAENQHDKGRKGRAAKGEANGGGGKLTADDVREIRLLLAQGLTKKAIGEQFNVSATEVRYIDRGRHWGHIT